MKKGISSWAFLSENIKENMQLAKKHGFDGIELVLEENGQLNLETTSSEAKELTNYAKNIGLEFYSIATGLYWKYSITSDNKDERNKAKQIVKTQINLASMLGCNSILVIPGAVKVDFAPELGVVDYDVAYNRSLETFSELSDYAEKMNVNIGLENVWNKFLLSPLEMRDFIDKINSPYIGSYFDVGNVLYDGLPEQWIKILGQRIKKVHIKDFVCKFGGGDFVDLLKGDVDYNKVIKSLQNIGYNDWVTAEVNPDKNDNDSALAYTSKAMDQILSR